MAGLCSRQKTSEQREYQQHRAQQPQVVTHVPDDSGQRPTPHRGHTADYLRTFQSILLFLHAQRDL